MTSYVPYSFVPGTKARAQEVNANFNAVLGQIDTKANNDLSNLTETGINIIKNSSISRNIGEFIYSLFPQTDSSLHLLDGALLSGSGSYADFVTYIAGLVSDYPDLFETEANWQSSVTTYGVCGKFVYDSTNNTVRLPKLTGIIEGTTDLTALGDLVQAGLPNITGSTSSIGHNPANDSVAGAFKQKSFSYAMSGIAQGGIWNEGWGDVTEYFDASNSNSIYGNSTTVQPQTIKCLVYIVIATTSKTEIQVDIDEIATDLNGKADFDLSNINTVATSNIAGFCMPSDTSTNLTFGASGTKYTAPSNGWFHYDGFTTANWNYVRLETSNMTVTGEGSNANYYINIYLPVKKDDEVTLLYGNGTPNTQSFKFIYAQGSESEAQ